MKKIGPIIPPLVGQKITAALGWLSYNVSQYISAVTKHNQVRDFPRFPEKIVQVFFFHALQAGSKACICKDII